MIFITVGTHEQQMNRLFKKIDELLKNNKISEKVIAQIGYSTPNIQHPNFDFSKLYAIEEMNDLMRKCKIPITHGGPGTIFLAFQFNKIPIVVPRNPEYNEHVDSHQIDFCRRLAKENKIILVEEISLLEEYIKNYESLVDKMNTTEGNTNDFVLKFEEEIMKCLK